MALFAEITKKCVVNCGWNPFQRSRRALLRVCGFFLRVGLFLRVSLKSTRAPAQSSESGACGGNCGTYRALLRAAGLFCGNKTRECQGRQHSQVRVEHLRIGLFYGCVGLF